MTWKSSNPTKNVFTSLTFDHFSTVIRFFCFFRNSIFIKISWAVLLKAANNTKVLWLFDFFWFIKYMVSYCILHLVWNLQLLVNENTKRNHIVGYHYICKLTSDVISKVLFVLYFLIRVFLHSLFLIHPESKIDIIKKIFYLNTRKKN